MTGRISTQSFRGAYHFVILCHYNECSLLYTEEVTISGLLEVVQSVGKESVKTIIACFETEQRGRENQYRALSIHQRTGNEYWVLTVLCKSVKWIFRMANTGIVKHGVHNAVGLESVTRTLGRSYFGLKAASEQAFFKTPWYGYSIYQVVQSIAQYFNTVGVSHQRLRFLVTSRLSFRKKVLIEDSAQNIC